MTKQAFDQAVAEALALVDEAVARVIEREEEPEIETRNLQNRIMVALHVVEATPPLQGAADELYDAACAYADARRHAIRQGARCAGAQAGRDPPQHLALGGAVPLVHAGACLHVTRRL